MLLLLCSCYYQDTVHVYIHSRGDRIFLGMQDFDFVQIRSNLPKSNQIFLFPVYLGLVATMKKANKKLRANKGLVFLFCINMLSVLQAASVTSYVISCFSYRIRK